MRNYSYTAAWVVVFVLALAVTAYANGATSGVTVAPSVPAVEPAPVPPAGAGAGPSTTTTTTTTVTTTPMQQKCYTMDQLVTLTVSEAWELSGRNYSNMREFVWAMADVSASKRGLNIPNTREAGAEIGRLIRQRAEADPNQLLYAVVDSAVVSYAQTHGLMQK